MYHCIAQNDMGRAIRTVTLNVLGKQRVDCVCVFENNHNHNCRFKIKYSDKSRP